MNTQVFARTHLRGQRVHAPVLVLQPLSDEVAQQVSGLDILHAHVKGLEHELDGEHVVDLQALWVREGDRGRVKIRLSRLKHELYGQHMLIISRTWGV